MLHQNQSHFTETPSNTGKKSRLVVFSLQRCSRIQTHLNKNLKPAPHSTYSVWSNNMTGQAHSCGRLYASIIAHLLFTVRHTVQLTSHIICIAPNYINQRHFTPWSLTSYTWYKYLQNNAKNQTVPLQQHVATVKRKTSSRTMAQGGWSSTFTSG